MRPLKLFLVFSVIMYIGLFWQCASQESTIMQDEFDADAEIDANLADLFDYSDSEINDELDKDDDFMQKLQSYEPEKTTTPEPDVVKPAPAEPEDESLKDVLALLLGEDLDSDDSSSEIFPSTTESEPAQDFSQQSDDLENYALENDVERLESEFETKNAKADSLRRLVALSESRLEELEKQKSTGKIAPQRRQQAAFSKDAGFGEEYKTARTLFESRNYDGAIQSFSSLISSYPNNRMADNCQYWLGECYFGKKQYTQAVNEFKKVFSYRQKDKYDDAQLMIAISYLRQGNADQARSAFETFFSDYADSEYIAVAKKLYQKL